MLLVHWARRAASRAAWTAGSRSAISTAMIAMTTSSSIRVKARRRNESERMGNDSAGDGFGPQNTMTFVKEGLVAYTIARPTLQAIVRSTTLGRWDVGR